MNPFRYILALPKAAAEMVPLPWTFWGKCLFFILVIEGALRKWFLPMFTEELYFLKDGILILTLIKYLHHRDVGTRKGRIGIRDNVIHWMTVLCFAYGLLQCFNPKLGSPLIGLIGLRNYFLGLPLLYITQFMFPSRDSLFKFLGAFCATSLIVFPICVLQYNSPPDSRINVYAHEVKQQVDSVRVEESSRNITEKNVEKVRTTGPFSYITGLTIYTGFALIFLLPLYRYVAEKPHALALKVMVIFSMMVCLLLSSFLSGSRMPIALFGLYCIGTFTLHLLSGRLAISKGGVIATLFGVYLFTVPFYAYVQPWVERARTAGDFSDRVENIIPEMGRMAGYSGMFGFGIGRTFNGVDLLVRTFNLQKPDALPVQVEKTTSRLILELGIMGGLLLFALKLAIAFRLLLVFDRTRDLFLKELACSAFVYNVINLQYIPVSSMDGSIYFWFTASLVVLLPKLEAMSLRERVLQEELHLHPGAAPAFPVNRSGYSDTRAIPSTRTVAQGRDRPLLVDSHAPRRQRHRKPPMKRPQKAQAPAQPPAQTQRPPAEQPKPSPAPQAAAPNRRRKTNRARVRVTPGSVRKRGASNEKEDEK